MTVNGFACHVLGPFIVAACIAKSFALDTTCLASSGARVVTSSDSQWQADKAVYNRKINTEPAAVAYANNEAQVQSIVRCAKAAGIKAVPRGGGHGYEGDCNHHKFHTSYSRQPWPALIQISKLFSKLYVLFVCKNAALQAFTIRPLEKTIYGSTGPAGALLLSAVECSAVVLFNHRTKLVSSSICVNSLDSHEPPFRLQDGRPVWYPIMPVACNWCSTLTCQHPLNCCPCAAMGSPA